MTLACLHVESSSRYTAKQTTAQSCNVCLTLALALLFFGSRGCAPRSRSEGIGTLAAVSGLTCCVTLLTLDWSTGDPTHGYTLWFVCVCVCVHHLVASLSHSLPCPPGRQHDTPIPAGVAQLLVPVRRRPPQRHCVNSGHSTDTHAHPCCAFVHQLCACWLVGAPASELERPSACLCM